MSHKAITLSSMFLFAAIGSFSLIINGHAWLASPYWCLIMAIHFAIQAGRSGQK